MTLFENMPPRSSRFLELHNAVTDTPLPTRSDLPEIGKIWGDVPSSAFVELQERKRALPIIMGRMRWRGLRIS